MNKLDKAKKEFRKVHHDYYQYLDQFNCDEEIALTISATLHGLGLSLVEKLEAIIAIEEKATVAGIAPSFLYAKLDEYKVKFKVSP